MISLQFWRLEVLGQGAHWQGWFLLRAMRKRSAPGLCCWIVEDCFLHVSSQNLPSVRACIWISPSYQDMSYFGLMFTLMISFTLITYLKTVAPNTVIFWDPGVRTSTYEFGVGGSQFISQQWVWLLNRIWWQFLQRSFRQGKYSLDLTLVMFCCITTHPKI